MIHLVTLTDITVGHISCLCVCFPVDAVKLCAPVGPNAETDCSTRRCARRGVGQVRVFIVTGLVTMVTVQTPRVQCRAFPLNMRCFVLLCKTRDCISAVSCCPFVRLRYILDLNKEQEAGFAEKVVSIALEAEFEPWQEGRSDGVHAVFVAKKK